MENDVPKNKTGDLKIGYNDAKSICMVRKQNDMDCRQCKYYKTDMCYDVWRKPIEKIMGIKRNPLFELSIREEAEILSGREQENEYI